MALGEFKLFQMKSRKQREKEAKEYAIWAFPYGDLQREHLTALMRELIPKGPVEINMASFLTCKELYEGILDDLETRDAAVDRMINGLRSYGQLIKASEMPVFLALVLADTEVDESCEYPSADEMRERIKELTALKKDTKLKLFKRKPKDKDACDST